MWQWQGEGPGAWYFVSVPKEYYQELRMLSSPLKAGFGSIRVKATIGDTAWDTSIFPDTKSESYLLPIKKQVRLAEGLNEGSETKVELVVYER